MANIERSITIAIFGVTGRLGSRIALHLLNNPSKTKVKVHGFGRTLSKLSTALLSDDFFISFSGDALNTDDIRRAIKGCSSVICTYANVQEPDWSFTAEKLLIDVCEEENVPRYFAANYTGDFTKLERNDLPLVDPMIKIRRYMDEGKHTGALKNVTAVHILCAGFAEMLFKAFLNPNDLHFYGSADDKWGLACYETCAKFTAEVALDEKEPSGIFKFADCRVSINEIAAAVSTLKRNGTIVPIRDAGTREDLKNVVDQARQEGKFFQHLVQFCHYYFPSSEFGIGSSLDNYKYPAVTTLSLDELVEKHVV